jgi:glycosyltransferase involved in cell wall biosynthesis
MIMLKNQDIVFLSGIRWDFSHQRHQELATLFACFNRVFFVEMALSPANLLKEAGTTISHWKDWIRGIRKIQPNLLLYTAPPILPLGRSFFSINMLNQHFIYRSVNKAMRRVGMKKPIFWISDPYFSFFSRRHGQILTIYDWIHDNPARRESKIDQTYRKLEKEVLGNTDIIFTPSRLIYDRHGKSDPCFHLVPHGVDYDLFNGSGGKPPEEMEQFPSPVIGFIGTIGSTVDIDLLETLAGERKNWSFVFIGDVRRDVGKLRSYPNIHFLGSRSEPELPRYLRCFSAGIIPYVVSPATRTVHPVKTYEYLAAGIPVVSTRLPELEPLRGMIELADGGDEFISGIDKVLREDTPKLHQKRSLFARENSWESRMQTIERIIAEMINLSLDRS